MGEKLDKETAERVHTTGRCPDCGGQLLKGPPDGMAINVMCEKCKNKFWLVPGTPGFGVERI